MFGIHTIFVLNLFFANLSVYVAISLNMKRYFNFLYFHSILYPAINNSGRKILTMNTMAQPENTRAQSK